jgi:hypothetical protein
MTATRHRACRSLATLGLAACLMLPLAATHAQPRSIRLDDTGTRATAPNVQLQWRTLAQGGSAKVQEAQIGLVVRLDTRAHAGRSGRIYLVMPPDPGSAVALQWQSRGRLLSGRISAGERVLVHQGVIPGPTLEDQWALMLSADGEWVADARRLELHFDLELD